MEGVGDPANQGSEPPWKPTFLLIHGQHFLLVLRLSTKSQNPSFPARGGSESGEGWSRALCPASCLPCSLPVMSCLGIIWQCVDVWGTMSPQSHIGDSHDPSLHPLCAHSATPNGVIGWRGDGWERQGPPAPPRQISKNYGGLSSQPESAGPGSFLS